MQGYIAQVQHLSRIPDPHSSGFDVYYSTIIYSATNHPFRHKILFFFQLDLSGSEPDDAVLEEKAALTIQKRMMEQLDDQDFGFDLLEVMFQWTDGGFI